MDISLSITIHAVFMHLMFSNTVLLTEEYQAKLAVDGTQLQPSDNHSYG